MQAGRSQLRKGRISKRVQPMSVLFPASKYREVSMPGLNPRSDTGFDALDPKRRSNS